uniref:Uncharacterized protein n=1 Tax=Strigamia maritima TaxID=126957 RepID=T1IHD6_STRMM
MIFETIYCVFEREGFAFEVKNLSAYSFSRRRCPNLIREIGNQQCTHNCISSWVTLESIHYGTSIFQISYLLPLIAFNFAGFTAGLTLSDLVCQIKDMYGLSRRLHL